MAIDRLINSTQGDSIITKLDDIKTAINNQSTAATEAPLMDGTATVGTSTKYARENHVHPTDTSRAANVMSTYSVDTTRENITTSSTVQEAIEQLEYREELNKTNILLSADQSTQYNIVPIKSTIITGNASVTATVGADKSITITITGTTSSAIGFEISDNFNVDTNTEYVMTGNPSSGAIRLILQQAESPYNWIGQQYNNQASAVSPNISLVRYYVYIYANSSGTITIKPMLTPKALWDKGFTQYQPYALPNTAITPALQECVDNGVKNLYQFQDLGATAGSGAGVTLTDNGDGTFTATGTASGANYARYLLKQAVIKAGNYVITGISGGSLETYRLRVGTGNGDAYLVNLENNSAQFTITSDTTITVQFVVNSGKTVTNLSIKPMIITEAMYKAGFTDFQPYAMSNVELTEEVTSQEAGFINSTGSATTLTIEGLNTSDNPNCLLMCTDLRDTDAKDSLLFITRYLTNARINKVYGDITPPTISISGDVITLSGMRTYQKITAIAHKHVTLST